uniref:Leukocyte receptor cluster member 1 n=1 Tax=Sphenodon punctatus TaxID=8508 RepID=A0A8D0GWF2_SPHPU
MNILPKKSWHVRNRDNVARVRRDEAAAEAERAGKEARALRAEQEARTKLLRKKAQLSGHDSAIAPLVTEQPPGHLNLFSESQSSSGNQEHEEEKRHEKERQEKALGILTYLGQSSAEAQTSRPWYQQPPALGEDTPKEKQLKGKLDPLAEMERMLHKKRGKEREKGKRKREEKPAAGPPSLEQLRQERLHRERAERVRAEALMAARTGESLPQDPAEEPEEQRRGYNSQFHPELARKRHRREPW